MGLAERRAAEQYKNDEYPEWKRKLDEAAGFELSIEVKWDELAVDDYANSYSQFFPKVYFEPLQRALAAVAIDDMGKQALKASLKSIVVRNSNEYSNYSGFKFANGILTIDHKPSYNIGDVDDRAKGIQKLLESAL